MEKTVDVIESMFQNAEAHMDQVSVELETTFKHESGGASGGGEEVNPVVLLKKIKTIKEEYAEIVKEAQAIAVAQQEAMDFFRSELGNACEALMKLQLTAGQPAGKPEELECVEKMLGISGGSPALEAEATPEVEEEEPVVEELNPALKRSNSSELIEISEAEFASVSSLVRGRVKRTEVNFTYRILWSLFKEKGNTKPLSPQDMHQMGLRVTGQTGQAKLNVLKQLKLLKIARNGNVELM